MVLRPFLLIVAILAAQATLGFQFPTESQSDWDRVLFYKEGPSATTKVLLDPDTREKSMSVDGIDIGGTGFTDYKQQLLAHLPKLLVDDYSRELSIGLGSAILVGANLSDDNKIISQRLRTSASFVSRCTCWSARTSSSLRA